MTLEERLFEVSQNYVKEQGFGELSDGTYVKPTFTQLTDMFAQITSFYGVFVEEYNELIGGVSL